MKLRPTLLFLLALMIPMGSLAIGAAYHSSMDDVKDAKRLINRMLITRLAPGQLDYDLLPGFESDYLDSLERNPEKVQLLKRLYMADRLNLRADWVVTDVQLQAFQEDLVTRYLIRRSKDSQGKTELRQVSGLNSELRPFAGESLTF